MFNKCIFSGRLVEDPLLKQTNGGKSVLNVKLAVVYNTVNNESKTVWPKCTFWGKNAEVLARYRKKGDIIFVETHLEPDDWYDPITKKDVHGLVFIVDRLHLEDNRPRKKKAQADADSSGEATFTPVDDYDDQLPF